MSLPIRLSAPAIQRPFRRAVADYLERERRQVAREGEAMAEFLPFREQMSDDR